MKTILSACAIALCLTVCGGEVFGLRGASDVRVVTGYSGISASACGVFDDELGRDVVKVTYSSAEAIAKKVFIDIEFPALASHSWQSIDEIKLRFKGGLGRLSIAVYDKDGEEFRFKKTVRANAESAWRTCVSSYRDSSTNACNQYITRKNKAKANGVIDSPVKVGTLRLVIDPDFVKKHYGVSSAGENCRIKSIDLFLSDIEIDGVKDSGVTKTVTKSGNIKITFDEIGTVMPLDEGNKDVLFCRVHNSTQTPKEIKFTASSKLMLTTKKEEFARDISLAAGEEKLVKLPFKFRGCGFYDVLAAVTEGECVNSEKTFVNVWRTVGNSYDDDRDVFFATQAGLDLFNDKFGIYREQDYRTMQRAGVKMLRFVLRWRVIQPTKDGPLDWSLYDRIIERVTAHGMKPYLMLSNAPDWAADTDVVKSKPKFVMSCAPDNDLFAEFCARCVERYGKQTKYFQIWNEPYAHHYYWGGNEKTYAEMLKKSYAAMKAIDPSVVVCAGAAWPEVMQTAKGSYDYWPFHCHGTSEVLYSAIQKLRKALVQGETMRKYWCDETGFATDPRKDGSEIDKASVIAQKGIMCRGEGLSVHVWFGYRHSPRGPLSARDNFLAVDEKNRCRPVVNAHNTMVRMIHGADAIDKLYENGSGAAYLFKQGDRKVLAFWRTDRAKGQVLKVTFNGDIAGKHVTMFGTETEIASAGGEVSFPMTHEVQYLAFRGDVKGMDIVSFVNVPYQKICSEAERTMTIEGTVTNPFQKNLRISFRFAGCEGWKPENGKFEVSVKNGQTQTFRVKYLAQGNVPKVSYPTFSCEAKSLGIDFVSDMKFMSSLRVTSEWAQVAELTSEKNVTNLRTGDVDADLFWQGEKDLSANVLVKHSDEGLCLRVEAEDDKHCQKNEGFGIFDGDSLQVQVIGSDSVRHQFGIALTDNGKQTYAEYRGKFVVAPKFSVSRNNTKTIYEVCVPWNEIGLVGKIGETFDLSCLVNDNDGRFRKVLLEWGGGIHGMKSGPMNPMMITK